jgi:hypothetical protein
LIKNYGKIKTMSYGVIEYNEKGKPLCEVCGRAFDRVVAHVRQVHNMNEREYKDKYGFDHKKGICSKASAERSRITTLANYNKCIKENLLKKGQRTRFKDGDHGRTIEQVSEQTLLRLKRNVFKMKKQQ